MERIDWVLRAETFDDKSCDAVMAKALTLSNIEDTSVKVTWW